MRLLAFLLLASAVCLGAVLDSAATACAACHPAEVKFFGHTGMTLALESAAQSEILKAHPRLAGKVGDYAYEITRVGDQSIYSVTDGKDAFRVPIEWAFGQGAAGQTYVFERDGRWYESRVSFFAALDGLDLTIGAQEFPARNVTEAAGHRRTEREVGECFNCHATHAVRDHRLTPAEMTPGIQCERCHGPSAPHLIAVRTGDAKASVMRKLGQLNAEGMSDFCGQCHRTFAEIAANGPQGVRNVRFQPYRLANSKCYDTEDARIRCTACHDPHRELERSDAAYDAKCLACHSRSASPATSASALICRIAKKDCVTCHMPKVEIPGSHNRFTDHLIRIVKGNEKYPD